jgi:hypothetical protein
MAFEENLNSHSRAMALALDDHELPVHVQALVIVYDSVRDAVSPQVGKVVQDLFKLSDETDLDILNHSMEAMVDQFKTELLPVASQLTTTIKYTALWELPKLLGLLSRALNPRLRFCRRYRRSLYPLSGSPSRIS